MELVAEKSSPNLIARAYIERDKNELTIYFEVEHKTNDLFRRCDKFRVYKRYRSEAVAIAEAKKFVETGRAK